MHLQEPCSAEVRNRTVAFALNYNFAYHPRAEGSSYACTSMTLDTLGGQEKSEGQKNTQEEADILEPQGRPFCCIMPYCPQQVSLNQGALQGIAC